MTESDGSGMGKLQCDTDRIALLGGGSDGLDKPVCHSGKVTGALTDETGVTAVSRSVDEACSVKVGDTEAAPVKISVHSSDLQASPQQVMFEADQVEAFVGKKNLQGLETYLLKFLSDVDGGVHPSLLFVVYEATIAELIKEKETASAKSFFDLKVEPLLSYEDTLYWPIDLKICILKLKNCITKSCLPLPKQSLCSAITHYMMLYFPHHVRHIDIYGRDSTMCFVRSYKHTVSDKLVEKHICLACGYQLSGRPAKAIAEHVKHHNSPRRCPSVTKSMIQLLHQIEERQDPTFEDIAKDYRAHPTHEKFLQSPEISGSSKSAEQGHVDPRLDSSDLKQRSGGLKRKAPGGLKRKVSDGSKMKDKDSYSDDESLGKKLKDLALPEVCMDPKPQLMNAINKILSSNFFIATQAGANGGDAAAVLESICFRQGEAITELINMFITSRKSGDLLNVKNVPSISAERCISFARCVTPRTL